MKRLSITAALVITSVVLLGVLAGAAWAAGDRKSGGHGLILVASNSVPQSLKALGEEPPLPPAEYCLNGQTTTLPAGVAYEGGSATLSQGTAELILNTPPTYGFFYAGFWIDGNRPAFYIPESATDTPEGVFSPGYSPNFISRGPCATGAGAVTNMPGKVYGCLVKTDAGEGHFFAQPVSAVNSPDGKYSFVAGNAYPANMSASHGATCDDPLVVYGEKAQGYRVDAGRVSNPISEPYDFSWLGLVAPPQPFGGGVNNLYPFYA